MVTRREITGEPASIFDVEVVVKLDKARSGFVFNIKVRDENGADITSLFRFYAKQEPSDIGRTDCLDAVIKKLID
jgi:hypothetical protein